MLLVQNDHFIANSVRYQRVYFCEKTMNVNGGLAYFQLSLYLSVNMYLPKQKPREVVIVFKWANPGLFLFIFILYSLQFQ